MEKPQTPINEQTRLKTLQTYQIIDSIPEQAYDDITRLAAIICDTPISLVSIVDSNKQFFKSRLGLDISETPRDYSFCAHAINTPNEIMIVPDSRLDSRFVDNPLVTGFPGVIFYAGMPLVTSEGYALGSLCVIDNKPRHLSEKQMDALKSLSNQVMQLLELRRKNDLLLHSQKQLSVYAEQMETFAFAASHDLKEPLRNVSMFLQLLEEEYATEWNEEAREYIGFALSSAKRMDILINDLLSFSEAGKSALEVEPVNINELVDEIKALLSLAMEEKNARIEIPVMPEIRGSRVGIRQVLQNLIGNALKYQADGVTPLVIIGMTESDDFWEFSVSDNGIGIPEHQHEAIFIAFKRLHRKEKYAGTGLGLAICNKIIEQHHGHMRLESEPGKGSTFYFSISKNIGR